MRRLRDWRSLATTLGFVVATAPPAAALAHALAHHREAHAGVPHPASVDVHNVRVQWATGDHAGDHTHARLDQATRPAAPVLVLGLPVTATAGDFELAPCAPAGDRPAVPFPGCGPPSDDPPRLRAPPLT